MERQIKKKKVTNVASTSIDAYHEITAEGQIKREKALAIEKMLEYEKPVTSRKLAELTGKERTNCTRVLYDLEHSGIAKVCKTDKCPVTNKRVQYYQLNTPCEAQASV